MKILVFSDTHGRGMGMLDAVQEQSPVDTCFFLGDGIQDVQNLREAYPDLQVLTVLGNCDPARLESIYGFAVFSGKSIYYTHGHTLRVKSTQSYLWQEAKSKGADIVLYGHTHVPRYELRDGIHLFNPGSLGMPRDGRESYGVINIVRGKELEFTIVYNEG